MGFGLLVGESFLVSDKFALCDFVLLHMQHVLHACLSILGFFHLSEPQLKKVLFFIMASFSSLEWRVEGQKMSLSVRIVKPLIYTANESTI